MTPITIRARVESDTLVIPGLAPFIGKDVEVRVSEESESSIDDMIDWEYLAELEAEEAAEQAEDPFPIPTLEEVRLATSGILGNISDDISAERDER